MIIILSFIAVCMNQIIDINFQNSTWTRNQSGSYNYTYKISQSSSYFIYVQIILSEANPNFVLVSKSGSPVADFYEPFTQGSTIDMISVYENRLTRFLQIPTVQFPIYISTFDETTKSSYQIIVSSINTPVCDNNCSNNGSCTVIRQNMQEYGCLCYYGYVGNDCHQEAQEIIIDLDDNYVTFQKSIQYFYIDLQYFEGSTIKLKFSIESDSVITIFLELTQALILPNLYNFDSNMVERFTVTNSDPIFLEIEIPEYVQFSSNVVFAAVLDNGYINNTFYDVLLVNRITDSEEDNSKTTIIVAVVVSVVGAIIIAIAAFFIYRYLKKKKGADNQMVQYVGPPPMIQLQQINILPLPEVEQQQINQVNQNLIQISQKEINPDETCSVCLENLVNGKELIQTQCKHTFHKQCIIQWAQKHLECPVCRTGLATVAPQT